MEIDAEQRTVRLSVGAFASFSPYPSEASPGCGGQWRAEAGTAWHNELRQSTEKSTPGSHFEVPINGMWREGDWQFHLQGRIDQILPLPDGLLLREVKSVHQPLPTDPETLRTHYPSYFRQIAAYQQLARVLPEYAVNDLQAELLFVEISEGLTQRIALAADEAASLMTAQSQTWVDFLEHRRNALQRLRSLTFHPAFPSYREGQAEAAAELQQAQSTKPITLLEAPTGFGKTGLVLEYSLGQLKAGRYERLIFLSGKSTGQIQARLQLETMLPPDTHLRYHILRNQQEHSIESVHHTCDPRGRCRQRQELLWPQSGLQPSRLLDEAPMTVARAQQLGAQTGLCPYEIARAVLPYAEVWIGDYNYLFHPGVRSVFLDTRGYIPERTLLIVDEAHNLPARVADAWSHRLEATALQEALSELHFGGAPAPLRLAVEQLLDGLLALRPCENLDDSEAYPLLEYISGILEALPTLHYEDDRISPWTLRLLWGLADLRRALQHSGLERLLHIPQAGTFALDCLSAAPEVAEILHTVGGAILMSATLRPQDLFIQSCGLQPQEPNVVCATAPWRAQAYTVAVDLRVDTRLRHRDKHLLRTAQTVIDFCQDSAQPAVVFFPSYRYAESVLTCLQTLPVYLHVALQPRGVDLPEQQTFLREALLTAHALFLIMGSSFSESIDVLGGRVSRAMLVSPALPEVNAAQNARMAAREHLDREAAFREVYLVPAFTRIHQALGRLVRAPGQHASILLHGKRFNEPAYHALLAPEYQQARPIHNEADLQAWLKEIQHAEQSTQPRG